MKFLANSAEANGAIKKLLKSCKRIRWAVAWASCNFPAFEILKKHKDKIQQLSVGIHFYQTHPDFIETFMEHPNVRFVMNPSGVFHPKLYLFENHDGAWDCITGSFNFTKGGLSLNAESGVHFCNSDVEQIEFEKISSQLDSFFSTGDSISRAGLNAYRSIWQRQQRRLGSLSGDYGKTRKSKPHKSPLDVPIFAMQWDEYFKLVSNEDSGPHTTEGRLEVLDAAQKLFVGGNHFNELDKIQRRSIAGLNKNDSINWEWFGSMTGRGTFQQAINENEELISEALDEIPMDGGVDEQHLIRFLSKFKNSFKNSGIGTASRLLAMKRPDYFVCVDSRNRKKLCKEFEIAQDIKMDDYWEQIVMRIIDSNWWNSEEPSGGLESRIWNSRSAFLDALFYEPK